MKYNQSNKPLVCMQTQSSCYKGTRKMIVKGVLWHSTGANNPWLKRYVQPSDNDPDRESLLALLGTNKNHNDWNHKPVQAGLNAWIGKLADGTVAAVQTMPWDFRPWGCYYGKNGSCNDNFIQFEICEDSLNDPDYFAMAYKEACELTAYLCKLYDIDPHGTVNYNGVKVPTILCHQDSYRLGLGSGHADVYHWFQRFGKDMYDVRNDVAALMAAGEEADFLNDQAKFNEMFANMRSELQDNDCGAWSQDAREWATSTGLIAGGGVAADGTPNYMWCDFLDRQQMVTLLYRFAKMMGKV